MSAATVTHQKHKTELEELILAAVGHVVDAAISKSVPLAVDQALGSVVEDLQAYTDGAEQDLHKQISELCASIGLISNSDTTRRPPRSGSGDRPDGHHRHSTTGSRLRVLLPYARQHEVSPTRPIALACCPDSSPPPDQSRSQSHHIRTPKSDFPRFDGNNPKFWQARRED
ncbi:hypothetical protein ZWY2020_031795 [Hordeum vulgare]|nr:hypothetical protein ZWY2020_031795 [Hordeum vulgare]